MYALEQKRIKHTNSGTQIHEEHTNRNAHGHTQSYSQTHTQEHTHERSQTQNPPGRGNWMKRWALLLMTFLNAWLVTVQDRTR